MMVVRCVTAGILVVTLTVLVTVLTLLYTMPKPTHIPTCERVCLASKPFSAQAGIRCGCSSDRLAEYLTEAIIIENERLESEDRLKTTAGPSPQLMGLLSTLRWNIKPSARITGKKQPPPRAYYGDMMPVREWHHKDDRAFLRYGMEYRHGRLVVPAKGTYLINSFLDLYETCKNATGTDESTRRKRYTDSTRQKRSSGHDQQPTGIKHAIYRFNILNGKEEELIRSEHPREVSQNGYFNIYDSYLAAAVNLDPGDEVYVTISDLKLLAQTISVWL